MGNYFRNENPGPQINEIIAADQTLFTTITFPWLLSCLPLICSTSLNQWPDEQLTVNAKHWALKVPKADSGFLISKSCLALLQLACSLDKFNVELEGWERARQVRWVLQGFKQFAREYFLLWLPWRSHCQRSLPLARCPAVSVKGSHGLQYLLQPPKHVLIQFGRYWVELSIAKTAFQVVQINQIQIEPSLTSTYYPICTSHHSALSTSDPRQGGKLDYQFSFGSGLKSY